jgi:hypothetical protein
MGNSPDFNTEVSQQLSHINSELEEININLVSLNVLGVRHHREIGHLFKLYLLAQVQLFALLLAVIVLVNN